MVFPHAFHSLCASVGRPGADGVIAGGMLQTQQEAVDGKISGISEEFSHEIPMQDYLI